MAFVGGAAGSVVAQTFACPIDVISQHMMLVGQKGQTTSSNNTNKINPSRVKEMDRIRVPEKFTKGASFGLAKYIFSEINKNEGARGLYRGYVLSTFLVSLNSAIWWPFYYFYQGKSVKA